MPTDPDALAQLRDRLAASPADARVSVEVGFYRAALDELAAAREWRDNLMNEWSRARFEGPYSNYTVAYDAARRATDEAMGGMR